MSLAADSPVHTSSSSDDFAAILNAELELISSDNSSDEDHEEEEEEGEDEEKKEKEEEEEEEDTEKPRAKKHKVNLEVKEEHQRIIVGKTTQESAATSSQPEHEAVCPPHPGFFRGLCMRCGQLEDDDTGVAFGYIHKDLRLGSREIDRLRGSDLKNLLRAKKLILILDLDHTLLNSTRLADISPEEEYLNHEAESSQTDPSRNVFKLGNMHLLTKLRPFVRTFLQEASSLFEMYIYTMAEKSYAIEIAKILDPDKVYFDSKVISQSDSTIQHQKGLDVVLGAESAVVILDDTEIVWQRHKENLILMERYHFFSSSCRQFGFKARSLAELKQDEREADGALSIVLSVLKRAHQMFFDPSLKTDLSSRDVRRVLKSIRQEILQGCKIIFSRVFPAKVRAEDQPIWKLALQLGAICTTVQDSSVTHIVSTDRNTEKARWAVRNEKFLVSPLWIEATNYLWKRQPEDDFQIPSTSSSKNHQQ